MNTKLLAAQQRARDAYIENVEKGLPLMRAHQGTGRSVDWFHVERRRDIEFERLVQDARQRARQAFGERLESEFMENVIEGVPEPILKNGEVVGEVRRKNGWLQLKALQLLNRDTWGERQELAVTGSIALVIDPLDRRRALLEMEAQDRALAERALLYPADHAIDLPDDQITEVDG